MDIKILIDTSADMPKELIEKYDFGVLSFMSIFGEKSYKSGVDITNEEFYDMLENYDGFPTTSQTPPAEMYDCFLKETTEHDAVIFFTISSKGSGQNHTAQMMREQLLDEKPDAKLYIVDSMSYSLFIAMTAVKAAEMAEEGKTPEEIVDKCEAYIKTWNCKLVVDDLTYLEKGGRINKTSAIIGSLLDIKPVLTIKNGLVEADGKLRGKKKIIDKLIAVIEESPEFNSENPEFAVVHSDDEKGKEAVVKLEEKFGKGCIKMYSEFGPIIGTHVGRGGTAILYRTNRPME